MIDNKERHFDRRLNVRVVEYSQGKKFDDWTSPCSNNDLKRLGFDCWLKDVLTGPKEVINTLCHSNQIQAIVILFPPVMANNRLFHENILLLRKFKLSRISMSKLRIEKGISSKSMSLATLCIKLFEANMATRILVLLPIPYATKVRIFLIRVSSLVIRADRSRSTEKSPT